MEIDFSSPGKAEEDLEKAAGTGEEHEVYVRDGSPVEDLYTAVRLLKDRASWVKNIGVTNRQEEWERLQSSGSYEPGFEFRQPGYRPETLLRILESVSDATEKIDGKAMEKYGAEALEPGDLRKLFNGVFEELSLWVRLASNIEERDAWRKYSSLLWPMVDDGVAEDSRKQLEKLEPGDGDKNLEPARLEKMFREELESLGMDYTVQIQSTSGCFNIPEDQTLVVAEGENGDRRYSRQEAEVLTKHEVFHAARSFNGFNAGRDSGFPPVLGVHTPFYDRIDEGGAVHREHATGVSYPGRDFDYHLRLMAAYYLHRGRDYSWVIDKLQEFGGSERRAFDLVARNRSLLRHHIYWAGYRDWRNTGNHQPLLVGKVNQEWADKIWQEVEAGGMVAEPRVTAEDLFPER